MNPLAPALPLPKPKTLETPETPQVPQHVYDSLEQAANVVDKSGLTQEEQGQITKYWRVLDKKIRLKRRTEFSFKN